MSISLSRADIPLSKVLARLGYAQGKTVLDGKTETIIEEELGQAFKLITPKQVIALSPVTIGDAGRVTLNAGFSIMSLSIAGLLKECGEAAGFAVTIGKNLEEKRNMHVAAGRPARALILDAIGSVMAEELAEAAHRQISDHAGRRGLSATRRFSPGYGDWDLKSQKGFLAWLGAAGIGIKLNPSYQMSPEKSVSALLGLQRRS